jgi:hypothetical protein
MWGAYITHNRQKLVGATGIEPVTPAMSRQGLQRNALILLILTAPLICLCATIVLPTFSLAGSMNQRALCYEAEFLFCLQASAMAQRTQKRGLAGSGP